MGITVLVLQGRLDSTRLPGKSLLDLGGRPLILRVMEALKCVPCDVHVLACPEDSETAFAPFALEAGFELVAGPKDDVLARYCAALRKFLAGTGRPEGAYLVRATGDNPFVFADAATALVAEAVSADADYAVYTGLPYGSGVEAVKAAALFRAEKEAFAPPEREHVCPYLYNHPELFRLHRPPAPVPWYAPEVRLTVDTADDYRRAGKLYAVLAEQFGYCASRYSGENILAAAGTGELL